jgi:mono/diheme cytochrome c family protein
MRALILCAIALSLAACAKQTQDMDDQPKLQSQQASAIFADGRASQMPPAGTVAASAGSWAEVSSGLPHGSGAANVTAAAQLTRGRARYDIYCSPCHGVGGDGNGLVAQRGFPPPPSYHSDRLRGVSDDYLVDVIRDGHGLMFGYADRIDADDRRAIVAYLRALQLSQHAQVAQLSAEDRAALQGAKAATR